MPQKLGGGPTSLQEVSGTVQEVSGDSPESVERVLSDCSQNFDFGGTLKFQGPLQGDGLVPKSWPQGDEPGEMGDALSTLDLGHVTDVLHVYAGPWARSVCAEVHEEAFLVSQTGNRSRANSQKSA